MENLALKQQEKIFYNAMVKVNYASTLNNQDVCACVGLSSDQIFGSDFYFMAFENAYKKYMQEK